MWKELVQRSRRLRRRPTQRNGRDSLDEFRTRDSRAHRWLTDPIGRFGRVFQPLLLFEIPTHVDQGLHLGKPANELRRKLVDLGELGRISLREMREIAE